MAVSYGLCGAVVAPWMHRGGECLAPVSVFVVLPLLSQVLSVLSRLPSGASGQLSTYLAAAGVKL